MKDYSLIRYLAKLTGAKLKRNKDELCCYFPYSDNGDAFVPTHIIFEHRQSVLEFFDLTEVYIAYGKQYDSYEKFIDAFVSRNEFFTSMKYNGTLCVQSDLTVNKIEHTASPALVNYSLIIIALNEMLGRKEKVISEDQWRSYHRDMLKKLSERSRMYSYIGAGAFIGGILLAVFFGNGAMAALAVLLILGGLIAAPFFFLRGRFYRRLYRKALNEKHY